jgi:putative transposase
MGKPPALPEDSQSLTAPEMVIISNLLTAQSPQKGDYRMEMQESLRHTVWDCKYPVVWIPKYRKKTVYGELRRELGEVFRELAKQKESRIEEGPLQADHMHMLISIPPKYSIAQVIGFMKGKSAIHIARTYINRRKNFIGENFWARGYYVSTAGKDEAVVRRYIKQQEAEDRRIDQLNLFD